MKPVMGGPKLNKLDAKARYLLSGWVGRRQERRHATKPSLLIRNKTAKQKTEPFSLLNVLEREPQIGGSLPWWLHLLETR